MNVWLISLGNKYLNRTNIILISKVVFVLQICLVFIVFRVMRINGILGSLAELIWVLSLSGKLLQIIQDIGLSALFLGLMTSAYKNGYQVPMLGYLIILMFCMGVLTFVVNSTGGHRGTFFFLSSIITSVLQVVVGYHLQKTAFARLGKFIIAFPIVSFLGIVLLSPYAAMTLEIINTSVLVYAFYKEPLLIR